jgi:hypothetical protein
MLWSVQELRGMQLVACDGDVGTVRDAQRYFESSI